MATRRPVPRELVTDASATASWALKDEYDPGAESVLDEIRSGHSVGVVPRHWQAEISNAILYAEVRGRISWEEIPDILSDLNDLHIETDAAADILSTFNLAKLYGLTVYDALYLELAIRRDLPLATLDDKLRRAASQAGVVVLT